jgi:hypothetical protein
MGDAPGLRLLNASQKHTINDKRGESGERVVIRDSDSGDIRRGHADEEKVRLIWKG